MSMASTPIGGHCVALWCPTVFSAWVKWWHPPLFRKSSMKPRPSGSQCQVSCIYLWWGWDSKLQFIKEPPPLGCASSSALEAPYTLTMFFVTENQSSALEVGTFYAVAPQIAVTRLSPLCTGLCPLQIKGTDAYSVFCPWRQYISSSLCNPERGTISPSVTHENLTPLCACSPSKVFLLTRSTHYSSILEKVSHFPKLRVWAMITVKNLCHSAPPTPQSVVQ